MAELVSRIPAHTPEWTNPRQGDPGRTLIELFAWLGDALLYRANLIPERQRLAFLRLLGQPLNPARPARGLVTVSLKEGETPAACLIAAGSGFTGPVSFEARDEFTVLPVTAAAYFKRSAVVGSTGDVTDAVVEALSSFHNAGSPVKPYVTTPLFAGGQPSSEGFDIAADTADRCLWIALFAPKAPNASQQPATNLQVTAALGSNPTGGRQLLNIGWVPALPTTNPLDPITAPVRVPHVWEITANTTSQSPDLDTPWRPEFLAIDEVADTTFGLTRRGVLRLALPRGTNIHAPENDVRVDPNAGVGDRPPRLDDPALAARLVAWIRLRPEAPQPTVSPTETEFVTGQGATSLQSANRRAGFQPPREVEHLRVVWAGVNAVEIEQLVTRSNVVVAQSAGIPDLEIQLPASSIEPETLDLQVEEDLGWVSWQRVEDLAALDRDAMASHDARAFQLDSEAGTVRFGDGVRGRIPEGGRRIRVARLRASSGSAGNIPAGSLKAITATTQTGESVGPRLVVFQPLPLTGGSDAETLNEAERRIPSRLRHGNRAVTADDYRVLARETPGIAVGRVELLPRFKPQQRFPEVPGVVTVMVLPDRPLAPAPNPRADRPFLEAIYAWLDPRRPLSTELYVIGCEYVPIALSVAITVADGAPPDTTLVAVKEALTRVLWPLAPGGFDRTGWPLGRALSNRELAVEVARVDGVSEVAGLNLFQRNPDSGNWQPVGDSRDGREQNLSLERWQLPELLAVRVVADDSATGAPLDIPSSSNNPAADPDAVAVPVVPDLC